MYTLLYLKWITNKDLLYSTQNSAQCYTVDWMGGVLGGELDTSICNAQLLSHVRLCNSMVCSPSLSMGFSWQEYWNGLLFPTPGNLPKTGKKPMSSVSPALQVIPSQWTTVEAHVYVGWVPLLSIWN